VSPHKHRIADYLRPKTLAMLLLGFSSGLPFLLVGNTFGYWLRDEHTSLTAIGFLSWVGIAYSLKFLWAPVMDRVDLPFFKRLGHRRGWMMFSQILVGLALCRARPTRRSGARRRVCLFDTRHCGRRLAN
jgi:PAT family beta-lactamase induction signal transducer AmpG